MSTTYFSNSNLGITRTELRGEIGRFLGYGRVWANLNDTAKEDLDSIIRRGLRQFYSPPTIAGKSHEWNFLRPTMDLTLEADVAKTGVTLSVTNDDGALTGSASSATAWSSFTDFDLSISGVFYRGTSYTGSGPYVANYDPSSTSPTGTKDVTQVKTYVMPHDFGGVVGDLIYHDESAKVPVRVLNETRWSEIRAMEPTRKGRPQYVCFVPANRSEKDKNLPAQWQAKFYPHPDKTYNIRLQYLQLQQEYFNQGDTDGQVSTGSKTVAFQSTTYLPVWAADSIFAYKGTDGTHREVEVATATLRAIVLKENPPVNSASDTTEWKLIPNRFPGGQQHSETILASCLAVAEEYGETPSTQYRQLYQERLAASISIDGQGTTAGILGRNLDRSDSQGTYNKYEFADYTVTVTGQTL